MVSLSASLSLPLARSLPPSAAEPLCPSLCHPRPPLSRRPCLVAPLLVQRAPHILLADRWLPLSGFENFFPKDGKKGGGPSASSAGAKEKEGGKGSGGGGGGGGDGKEGGEQPGMPENMPQILVSRAGGNDGS
eukprot:1675312-Rhodomonas_salina.2